jgi:hypothetical protein
MGATGESWLCNGAHRPDPVRRDNVSDVKDETTREVTA